MNELIKSHNKKKASGNMSEKEIKEKMDSLQESLESEGILKHPPSTSPGPAKRKPGRPRKASNPDLAAPAPAPGITERPAESTEDKLKRRRLVKQLRFLSSRFPAIVGEDLNSFNPHLCSLEQLESIIEEIKLAVSDSLEETTMPMWIEQGLQVAEDSAFTILSNGKIRRKFPILENLLVFRGTASVASQDPLIQADLALIASDFLSLVPSSPYIRLGMNIAKIAIGVARQNGQLMGKMPSDANIPEEFQEF